MFGIGGGELIFILFIVLMLFGADKIPDLARTLGKGMAQLKNATNDIKSEIHKGAEANGLDQTFRELHGNFTDVSANINNEINKAKANIGNNLVPKTEQIVKKEGAEEPVKKEAVKKVAVKKGTVKKQAVKKETPKKETDESSGPIKRQK